ncbi:MAG: M23 family metallopeptidase [Alphaproteobacteria bacterium]
MRRASLNGKSRGAAFFVAAAEILAVAATGCDERETQNAKPSWVGPINTQADPGANAVPSAHTASVPVIVPGAASDSSDPVDGMLRRQPEYIPLILENARGYTLDPHMLAAQLWSEAPNGVAQGGDSAAFVAARAAHMAELLKAQGGDAEKALAAYRIGEKNVDKAVRIHGKSWRNALPADARDYVTAMMKYTLRMSHELLKEMGKTERIRDGYLTNEAALAAASGAGVENPFLGCVTPLADVMRYTSLFRIQDHATAPRMHFGADMKQIQGTPVRAPASGVLCKIAEDAGYGTMAEICHAGGVSTVYGHLDGFAEGLKLGTVIPAGSVFAYVGMTGEATGYHLHFEARENGAPTDFKRLPCLSSPVPPKDPAGGAKVLVALKP